MNSIKITDDHKEMEDIGRALISEKASIYKENVLATLRNGITHHMPKASEEEKEARLYRAIYNYWVYGNTLDEDFYLGFGNKTHEQKLEYITMRVRMDYFAKLNDSSLDHLFDNRMKHTNCSRSII